MTRPRPRLHTHLHGGGGRTTTTKRAGRARAAPTGGRPGRIGWALFAASVGLVLRSILPGPSVRTGCVPLPLQTSASPQNTQFCFSYTANRQSAVSPPHSSPPSRGRGPSGLDSTAAAATAVTDTPFARLSPPSTPPPPPPRTRPTSTARAATPSPSPAFPRRGRPPAAAGPPPSRSACQAPRPHPRRRHRRPAPRWRRRRGRRARGCCCWAARGARCCGAISPPVCGRRGAVG